MQIPSMRYRHERGDMIEMYKFLHGDYKVVNPVFPLASDSLVDRPRACTRNNGLKLDTSLPAPQKAIRRHFFKHRAMIEWNQLPAKVVNASSTNAFKNSLDSHWKARWYRTPYGAFSGYQVDT